MSDRDPADTGAEDLDEDALRVDPLEEGVEPPEHWSAADKYGTTPSEALAGEGLERKLRAEQADVTPEDVPDTPVAAAPLDELDESVDSTNEPEGYDMPEPQRQVPDDAARRGQSADEAGGSMAESIRTPPDVE